MSTPKQKPELRELVPVSARDRWSSYPSSGLTPRKLSAILREADAGDLVRQMELFSEMEEKDAHLYSLLQTRKLAVTGCPYEIMPSGDTEADAKTAEFVRGAIDRVSNFEDALMDLMDAVGKGFSVCEILWSAGSDGVYPSGIIKRPQKRFVFEDASGNPAGPMLTDPDTYRAANPLTPGKFLVHTYRAGLLRVLGWVYLFKNYAMKDWVSFCEVFGMPVRLGVYSPSSTEEDRDALYDAVRSLGSDAAGIISETTRIEFIEAAKRSDSGPYGALIETLNREMSKAVLGQTLTSDVGNAGSYAAGVVHNGVRLDILKADARSLERTINRDLVRPIVAYNFGEDAVPPRFVFRTDTADDLGELARRDKTLSEMGLEMTEEYLRRRYGVPKE